MSDTYSFERDLKEAEAMVKALASYVRQDALYGTVGGMFSSGNMPSLTVGALLMRLRRLDVLRDELDGGQAARLDTAMTQNETVAAEWSLHYTGKVEREAKSRLDAMRTFFDECRSNPRQCAAIYKPEALRRTIVQELLLAMDELDMEADGELDRKLHMIDQSLRRWLIPADFLWSPQIEAAYSKETFWWLYQHPQDSAS